MSVSSLFDFHDHVPDIFLEEPSPDNVGPCAGTETSSKSLYVIWACFIAFDSSKSMFFIYFE